MKLQTIKLGIWIQVAQIICVVRRSCLQIWMTHFAHKWNSVMTCSFWWLEKGEFLLHWKMVITCTSMMFSKYLIWKVICWVWDSWPKRVMWCTLLEEDMTLCKWRNLSLLEPEVHVYTRYPKLRGPRPAKDNERKDFFFQKNLHLFSGAGLSSRISTSWY